MKIKSIVVTSLVTLGFVGSSLAAMIPLTNASFEDGPLPAQGGYNGLVPTNWVQIASGNGNLGHQWDDPLLPGMDGNIFAFWQGSATAESGLAQQLTTAITTGEEYQLTLAAYARGANKKFSFDIRTDPSIAGGVSLIGGAKTTGDMTDAFVDYQLSGTATADAAANAAYLVMYRSADPVNGQQRLDNVRLDTIPEPATLGLIGLFGAGILFVRRRLTI